MNNKKPNIFGDFVLVAIVIALLGFMYYSWYTAHDGFVQRYGECLSARQADHPDWRSMDLIRRACDQSVLPNLEKPQ
tara:strand:- start:81 stop:311 length:231 start_codon:yes stop_codon:yes gene_type:complete